MSIAVPEGEASDGKLSLEIMAYTAADVAVDIESAERGREAAGWAPNEKRLRQAQVLHALARFLDRVAPHMPEIAPILRKEPRDRRVQARRIQTGPAG